MSTPPDGMPAEPVLRRQADYLHRRLLGRPAPDDMASEHARAVRTLFYDPTKPPLPAVPVNLERLVDRNLDPEAVELYVRLRHGTNELGRRLHVLLYLIEIHPDTFAVLTLSKSAPVRAWTSLIGAGLKLPYLVIKGFFQCRRHRLLEPERRGPEA